MIKIIVQQGLLAIAGLFLAAWGVSLTEWWSFPIWFTGMLVMGIGVIGGTYRFSQLTEQSVQTNYDPLGSLKFDVDNDKKVYCTNSDYVNIILDRLQCSNTRTERYRMALQDIVDAVPMASSDYLNKAIDAGRELLDADKLILLVVLLFGTMCWGQAEIGPTIFSKDCPTTTFSKDTRSGNLMVSENGAAFRKATPEEIIKYAQVAVPAATLAPCRYS